MNTIVDGHAIAHKIKDTLKKDVVKFHTPIELSIIVVGNNAVTNTFVAAKERFASDIGVVLTKKRFSESVSSADLISYIHEVSERVQGIVVQLPLSAHISNKEVLAAIPVEKDIDLLNKETFDKFVANMGVCIPPVAGAVLAILDEHTVSVAHKKIAIIGQGKLVGLPVQKVLEARGGDVVMLHTKTDRNIFRKTLLEADIVVSGAGVPNLIQPDMVKNSVVLIDAGTANAGGSVVGDIAHACAKNASLFSQTPGGVGPLTVAILFKNLLAASE
ncbi:hypothetical protein CL644_01580 [bacterium]|nr:hypothetical protein [Parcubacteria group bacterium]MBF05378.1 hypothetical protein [bacterium]|tara:strand:+ start:17283 stop:18104 length:822 start_codon:yes stop_codon:yes gene_type:complete